VYKTIQTTHRVRGKIEQRLLWVVAGSYFGAHLKREGKPKGGHVG